ncbi:dihydrolipoyl dehydrogenase [Candidatus Poribacteria bacterium]|nr:dihydrolipoyl dehydrogenase [Candidatus Poribacteria bacterium]
MPDLDIAIIGAGPGGYVAAIKASQLGGQVCVIEKGELGGTCLNRGCIPTKTLYASAKLASMVKNAVEFGIEIKEANVDFAKVMSHKDEVVKKLVGGVGTLFKGNKIKSIKGVGKIIPPGKIEVTKPDGSIELVEARNIIIATGSEPANIPIFEIDEKQVLTSTSALELTELPKSFLIVGGGVIGCEFASIFKAFGCEVTIAELLPTILSTEDVQVIRQMQALLKRKGIKIVTKANITKVIKDENKVTAELESGEKLQAEKMLVSIGRKLNLEGIGLENVGLKVENGRIAVSERMQTKVENIYAVGDIANRFQLAHVASAEGIVAAQNCMGVSAVMDYGTIPTCIFTLPEIARVGLTEEQAKKEGYEVKAGRFPFMANGKALGMREADGFVKIVSDAETNDILGVHILGPNASELIHEASLAIKLGATVKDLVHAIHAHPTLSEAVMEAAEATYDKAIHLIS